MKNSDLSFIEKNYPKMYQIFIKKGLENLKNILNIENEDENVKKFRLIGCHSNPVYFPDNFMITKYKFKNKLNVKSILKQKETILIDAYFIDSYKNCMILHTEELGEISLKIPKPLDGWTHSDISTYCKKGDKLTFLVSYEKDLLGLRYPIAIMLDFINS